MTKSEVAKLVAVMLAAYPNTKTLPDKPSADGQPATFGTSAAYERMLADLEYPVANAAVEQLIATSPRFMPTIAEIRERCLALARGEVRAGGEAWGSVHKAIRGAGRYRTPGVDFVFADPVASEAVAALNWVELCDSENPVADRARFIALYARLAVTHRRSQLSDSLPAMQRFRALQAVQAKELESGPQPIGKLLQFAVPALDGDA